MKKVHSDTYPQIQILQGALLIPYNVEQRTRLDEDGERIEYVYELIRADPKTPKDRESIRKVVLAELNRQNNEYLSTNYDIGTQMKFQQMWNHPNVPQKAKGKIMFVSDWVDTVLLYYYGKKSEIRSAATIDDVMQVQWDFSQFDATKPDVSLEGLMVG